MKKRFTTAILFAMVFVQVVAQNAVEGSFIQVNGKKLWYHMTGKGEPLMLIPGGGAGSHHYFRPWFDKLAERYTVIYIDLYGRGHSARAADVKEYSFERDIDEIEQLRKALNLGKINILGQSFSGLTVQAYVCKYPESVNKVILMNPLISGEHYQRLTDRLNTLIFEMFPELEKKVMPLRSRGIKSSSPELQEAFFSQFADSFNYFYWCNAAAAPRLRWDSITFNAPLYYKMVGDDADFIIGGEVRHLDYQEKFKKAGKPTLIIGGRFDQVVIPKEVMKFHERMGKQAQLVFMERSGHFPWIEEPEKTFTVLKEFIQ